MTPIKIWPKKNPDFHRDFQYLNKKDYSAITSKGT